MNVYDVRKNKRERMVIRIGIAAGILLGGYLAVCLLVFFSQDGLIFPRSWNDRELVERFNSDRVQIYSDGESLEGWWIERPAAKNEILLIYFGGNAEDVLMTAGTDALDASRIFLVNYRGYGRSTGEPSQRVLYRDALRIYDYAVRERHIEPRNIVLMGRSLGAAVATMLSASRPVAGVVLVTPFDSMVSVASQHYSYLPVRWLLRHPFPSDEWAQKDSAPVLILAAERDGIIPPAHAKRLFDVWRGPKQFRLVNGVGHNDVQTAPEYYDSINAFMRVLNQTR
ncbi:MAG TPA: alpha/beta hydrolase [Steroidobacteraceae bacterium]|nr:alpha/beta hydrolase [Steroidobacteraceae bacterium]